MKSNIVKKSNGSLHTPDVITAKEVLAEIRKKNSKLEPNKPSASIDNSQTEEVKYFGKKDADSKVSFLSLFMGKTMRYIVVVLGLMFVSLVSYVLVFDNNDLDQRTNAQVTDQSTVSFNQQNVNSWQSICPYLQTTSCDLSFKTAQVYSIVSVNLPEFLTINFDVLGQSGGMKVDQNKLNLEDIDKPFSYSLKILTKSGNPFWIDREIVITSDTYTQAKSDSKYYLNFLNGECVQHIATDTLALKSFGTYKECNDYYYSIKADFKISTSISTKLDVANVCGATSPGIRQLDIPISWLDDSGMISYVKVDETNFDATIVDNYSVYSSKIADSLYDKSTSIDKLQNATTLRLRLKDSDLVSNISIPLEIYYPSKNLSSYKYNLAINLNLTNTTDGNSKESIQYTIGDDKETNLDLNYQVNNANCKFYLAKVELWDKNCSTYIDTISPESIVNPDISITKKYSTKNLQNSTYCVKILNRTSSSKLWQSDNIPNIAINTTKNTAPKIISLPKNMDILGNQQFNYQIQYSDLENDTAEIVALAKPSWLDITSNTISGVPTELGSNLVALQVVDKSGNASELQSFYLNVGSGAQTLTYDDSAIMAVNTAITVSGNIKVKWSISTYTNITKEEVYIAKQGNAYSKILTFDGGTVSSASVDSTAYSNGTYTFLIKAYLDDGSVIQQISSVYNFDNTPPAPISSSSSNSTSTTTNTNTSTSKATSTATATSTPQSTSTATSTYTETAASLSDSSPANGDKIEKSKFVIKGKISFPSGRSYLDNSFDAILNDKSILSACKIGNLEYSCDSSKFDLKQGSNTLKIKYSDDRSNTYTDLITFEVLADSVSSSATQATASTESSSTASSAANSSTGLAKVDDEKFFALFGRKIPYFLAYGIGIILLMLILVFTVPWILFYFQDRKTNAKAKRLATI